jgi:hypothetical protein
LALCLVGKLGLVAVSIMAAVWSVSCRCDSVRPWCPLVMVSAGKKEFF